MPLFSALAFATAFISNGLVTAGLGAAASAAGANLIVGSTLSLLSSKLFAPTVRQPSPKYSSVVNQEVAPRLRGYGRMLLGGVRGEIRAKDDFLYQFVMAHSGEIDAIEEVWAGDKKLTLDADGWATNEQYTADGRQFLRIRQRLGTLDQPAIPELYTEFPTKWTPADTFTGIAGVFGAFRSPNANRISRMWPEGYNVPLRILARLSKVRDPRTGVIAWSDNPALCIMDYLTSPDGYRLDPERIDEASVAAFADICDQQVARKGGGSQKRYTLNGVYSLQDDPKDVLGRMRATCDAELYETADGKIAIAGGSWEQPTVSILDRDILSHDLQQGSDRFETFNELKITYTSPKAKYQIEEATRWIDPDDQARRGVISSEFNVDMVQTAAQARRLAKIYRAKENPPWTGTITTNLVGLRARYARIIRLVIPELGIAGPFLVTSHGINADLSGCTIEVRWLDSTAYVFDPETEEDEEAPDYDDDPDPTIPVPAGLVLTVEDKQVSPTTISPVVVATVTDSGSADLDLEAQLRLSTRWEAMYAPDGIYEAVSSPVLPGETYHVRARFTGGDWTAESAITIPSS